MAAAAPLPAGAGERAAIRRPARLRLSRNESAYGPSPAALASVRDTETAALSLYPDVECQALRQKLAALHHVSAESIVLGAGATDVLCAIAAAFGGPSRPIIVAEPMCEVVGRTAERTGTPVIGVPLAHDWSHDLDAMLRRCDATTGFVYLCNPHNPTASLTPRSALDAFIRKLPATTHVVVDEAYHHYVSPVADYTSFLDRRLDDARVIVVRTFSKAYGLAGLRVGYAVADPSIAAGFENRETAPTITSVAAVAASAALDDQAHIRTTVARVVNDRQEFYNQANARMLRVIDSHANFVMLNTLRRSSDIVDHLARNGVAVPAPFAPLDEYIRVSLGSASDMDEFWRVWDLMSLSHTL